MIYRYSVRNYNFTLSPTVYEPNPLEDLHIALLVTGGILLAFVFGVITIALLGSEVFGKFALHLIVCNKYKQLKIFGL